MAAQELKDCPEFKEECHGEDCIAFVIHLYGTGKGIMGWEAEEFFSFTDCFAFEKASPLKFKRKVWCNKFQCEITEKEI